MAAFASRYIDVAGYSKGFSQFNDAGVSGTGKLQMDETSREEGCVSVLCRDV